ncbi:MAG: cytochrome c biogenesis protein ResB, partial [Candidatus Methylomirabilis sp.]|nr:cytochrome c biogenesis protein ResB [Deltaproteobacteria bacterium]
PDGAEMTRTDLRVNHPFKWESIRFYQASYGQSAKIVLEVWPGVPEEVAKSAPLLDASALGDHAPIVRHTQESPEPPKRLEAPIGWPADKPLRHVVFNAWDQVRFPFEGTTLQIMETQGDFGGFGPAVKVGLERANGDREMFWLFQRYPGFDAALRRGPETFVLRGVEPWFYTGIQVTKDPGVEVVYAGCLMLMAGLVFAFFQSHRRLWARVREKEGAVEVTVAADVNKNKLGFEREFDRLVAEFAARLGAAPARGASAEGDE